MKITEKTKMLFSKKNNKGQNEKKFMEASSLEEFKKMYITFHKQELALENDVSYFDVAKSNVDGHLFGEMFDNALRVRFLHENNKQFLEQVDEEELMKQVRKEFEEGLKKLKEE